MAKKVLVTAALPYANGSIHLGHMLEAVQTDVYVRARKMAGDDVIFCWADDTHGSPIQIRAKKEGISEQELIDRAHAEHKADYTDFGIGFDIFHSTHTEESERHTGAIFKALEDGGHTHVKQIEQFWGVEDGQFLADRFIKGTCPNASCNAPDQYGDGCEVCGRTYRSTEVLEPRSALSGGALERRSTEHVFVPLGKHQEFLEHWVNEVAVIPEATKGYLRTWMEEGLKDWDISRDEPYWGFPIPGHPGKYFYVWFDAPIGYVAATEKFCAESGRDFDSYWKSTPEDTEIVHVIGKDIVYFHCLFWPAMLKASGYTIPTRVQVHGWLQVNGAKMSKSKGTFILARTYLEHLSPAYLRYYLAAKLNKGQEDFDLSLEDFRGRVNADLVNKAANVASRAVKFLRGKLDGKVGALDEDGERVLAEAQAKLPQAAALFADFDSSKALALAIEAADAANNYITEKEPWKSIKTDPEAAKAAMSLGLQVSLVVAAILKPVIPEWAEKIGRMFGRTQPLSFANAAEPIPVGTEIGEYETLADRIDAKVLDAMVEASKQDLEAASDGPSFDYEVEALADEVSIDAFGAMDLRVARVANCESVEGAKKLLKLTLDVGPLGERQVFSGIAKSYAPEALVDKKVVLFANLKPRKMRFGLSEGMVLASGSDDAAITVLELADTAKPGEKIS
jgi:methionyl-tRNA synthetase